MGNLVGPWEYFGRPQGKYPKGPLHRYQHGRHVNNLETMGKSRWKNCEKLRT